MDYSEIVKAYCQEFNKEFIVRGSMILLDKNTAVEYIEYCFVQKYSVVCIDGFFLFSENRIQPTQDHSIDFTRSPFDNLTEAQIQASTMNFFHNEPSDVFYEIVVEKEQ